MRILLLPFVIEVLLLGLFILVGVAVIMLLKAAIFFLPAIILAAVVWWFTRSLAFAGLAFAIVPSSAFSKRSELIVKHRFSHEAGFKAAALSY